MNLPEFPRFSDEDMDKLRSLIFAAIASNEFQSKNASRSHEDIDSAIAQAKQKLILDAFNATHLPNN